MYSFLRDSPNDKKREAKNKRSYQKTVKEMFFKEDKKKSEHWKLINEKK